MKPLDGVHEFELLICRNSHVDSTDSFYSIDFQDRKKEFNFLNDKNQY